MPLPQARIVRAGGLAIAPPPAPRAPSRAREGARELLEILVGTWPVTALLVLIVGLLVLAANMRA